MSTTIGIGIFILGLFVGSFLNVVLLRHEKKWSWVGGRSHCPHCHRTLVWWELLPVVSFIVLRGSCRTCHHALSLQYPSIELLTGALFLLVYLGFAPVMGYGEVLVLVGHLVIWALLLILVVYDMWYTILPNPWVYSMIVVSGLLLVHSFFVEGISTPLLYDALAGPLYFTPFFLLWYLSQGTWIGLGDAKLAWGIGWFLGLSGGISALVFAFWIGALVSVSVLLLQRVLKGSLFRSSSLLTMKTEVPFAPFMILGLACVYFFDLGIFDVITFSLW